MIGRPRKLIDPAEARAAALEPVVRWGRRKRFALLNAIDRGDVTLSEVQRAHKLSLEEIAEWREHLSRPYGDAIRFTRYSKKKRRAA